MTQQQDKQAYEEGWGIFYTGQQDAVHNIYELQRIDEDALFGSDEEAIMYVCYKADKDVNSLYADAMRWLAKNSPNEIDSVFRDIWGVGFDELLTKLNIKL